eukprot:1183657-Ditylum_brightwellii.AAC.1
MNTTNISSRKHQIQGFFVLSNGRYTNRKAAHKELTVHLLMTGFDLHVHYCRHQHKQDTQTIAFSSDPDKSWTMKGKLYKMNNASKREKEKWPHTGHWMFVPFTAEGQITGHYIASML